MIRARWMAVVMLGLTGCYDSCFETFGDQQSETSTETTPTETTPPLVEEIRIADWPPVGPTGIVTATVSDGCCLALTRFTFKNVVDRSVSGPTATVQVSGAELGEGLGTLWVDAENTSEGWASRGVTDLLVDLTPPEADVGTSWLRAEGDQLEIWVGDAWVLGRVEVEFNGTTVVHRFPEKYPETIGVAWDHSLEIFPTSSFKAGSGPATVTVVDAAGNASVQTFDLTLDGTPPAAAFVGPEDGASVSGAFEVEIDALDDLPDVTVELYAGGELVATAPGPRATLTLESADFAPGALELTAIAVDRAGNVGKPVTLALDVE